MKDVKTSNIISTILLQRMQMLQSKISSAGKETQQRKIKLIAIINVACENPATEVSHITVTLNPNANTLNTILPDIKVLIY